MSEPMPPETPPRPAAAGFLLRPARHADVAEIVALARATGGAGATLTPDQVRSALNFFPEGQLVAERDGRIAGFAATVILAETLALRPHTFEEITASGTAARHDPAGDWLYGLTLLAPPSLMLQGAGAALVAGMKRITRAHHLKGLLIAASLSRLAHQTGRLAGPEAYFEAVRGRRLADPLLSMLLDERLEPGIILEAYRRDDPTANGTAALLAWRNETFLDGRARALKPASPDIVRVATVQYQLSRLESREQFRAHLAYFVKVASDYKSDFVVFPELYTLELLSIDRPPIPAAEALARLHDHTEWFLGHMRDLAQRHRINIIGGTHPTRQSNGEFRNVAYVFLRDGRVVAQDKIHPTPNEASVWNIKGGDQVSAIDTDRGPIGVLVCYDTEFPELPRHLADQGIKILFVPFCTDDRRGFLRVRYCCHARAIENQIYVAMSGVCGNLVGVENMDVNYAESAILTPCDIPFARDGIAADTEANVEMVAVADLDLSLIDTARREGSVRNFHDRRFDLYTSGWHGRPPSHPSSRGT